MAFTKITNADTANKGVVGLPDTPGLSAHDMQAKFDELATDVIIPKHNYLIDELEAQGSAWSLGAYETAHTVGQTTVQGVLYGLDTAITNEDTSLKAYVNAKDNATNARITNVENALNARIDAQNAIVNNALNTATYAKNTADAAYSMASTAYTNADQAKDLAEQAVTTANGAKSYVDVAVENLTNLIIDKTTITDPTTGQDADIQVVINHIYDYMRPAPITAKQYDDLALTAKQYDDYLLTAYQYDMFAAQELL